MLCCSYERVAGVVPEKHKKLIVHIEKMNERQKRKKRAKHEQVGQVSSHHPPHHVYLASMLGRRFRKYTCFQTKVSDKITLTKHTSLLLWSGVVCCGLRGVPVTLIVIKSASSLLVMKT